MQRNWWNKYVGTPFLDRGRTLKGADCWGLVSIVCKQEFKIELPDLLEDYDTATDAATIVEIFHRPNWSQEWCEVTEGQTGDIVMLRVGGWTAHVGIVTEPGMFLHCWNGGNATVESLQSIHWRNRIDSIWRHISRWEHA